MPEPLDMKLAKLASALGVELGDYQQVMSGAD
jgi:hypothetical protein